MKFKGKKNPYSFKRTGFGYGCQFSLSNELIASASGKKHVQYSWSGTLGGHYSYSGEDDIRFSFCRSRGKNED